jgi:hypothetical protein
MGGGADSHAILPSHVCKPDSGQKNRDSHAILPSRLVNLATSLNQIPGKKIEMGNAQDTCLKAVKCVRWWHESRGLHVGKMGVCGGQNGRSPMSCAHAQKIRKGLCAKQARFLGENKKHIGLISPTSRATHNVIAAICLIILAKNRCNSA